MTHHIQPQPGLAHLQQYVPGTPIEEVQRRFGIQHVIKLASNENPWGPSPKAVEAAQQALSRMHFYPDSECFDLRQALAAHLHVDGDQLIIGNGADGIIRFYGDRKAFRELLSGVLTQEYHFPEAFGASQPVALLAANETLRRLAAQVDHHCHRLPGCTGSDSLPVAGSTIVRFFPISLMSSKTNR